MYIGWGSEKGAGFHSTDSFSPYGVTGKMLNFPAVMCDNTCQVLPNRVTHSSVGVQGFYWGSVRETGATRRLTWATPSSEPSEVKPTQHVITVSHTVSAPWSRRHSLAQGFSHTKPSHQTPEVIFQESAAAKDQSLLRNVRGVSAQACRINPLFHRYW